MANDPSMPPSEQAATTPTDNSTAMSQAPMPPQQEAPDAGNVMLTVPKAAFDAVHALVLELATGLDQLKKNVDGQAGAGQPQMGAVAPESPETAPVEVTDGQSDDDFLKGLAEEGNKR